MRSPRTTRRFARCSIACAQPLASSSRAGAEAVGLSAYFFNWVCKMKYGLGQPVARKEDSRLVTGNGRYVDDIRLEGQAHAHIVYSDRVHALVRSVKVDRARAMPGVLAVLTGQDVAADSLGGIKPRFMPQDLP